MLLIFLRCGLQWRKVEDSGLLRPFKEGVVIFWRKNLQPQTFQTSYPQTFQADYTPKTSYCQTFIDEKPYINLLKFVEKIYKKPAKNIERFVIYLKNQIKGLKVL
jgi:hypothetical protein